MKRCKFLCMMGLISLSWMACGDKPHSKGEIEAAMKHYDRLIQRMDADSISMQYSLDGQLGEMAQGRDSIRKFLAAFKGYTVLAQSSSSDSVSITGDAAFQKGTYLQITVTPVGDTLHLRGQYIAKWTWTREGWRMKRMDTKPL